MSQTDLSGLRVLIVEDEPLIAMHIEDTLNDLGCVTVSIASNLADALRTVGIQNFDAALLDVNLHGASSLPVAELLLRQKKPFVFSTGYGISGVPEHFRSIPMLQKPFRESELRDRLYAAITAKAG
jgi:CheY-like chemotaxis protein